MKRLDAIYKCRLCGKEYVECSTSGEKSNQRFVMDMMYRAVRQKKPEEVMEPTLYECHFCGDGSYGVADFLGLKVKDEGGNGMNIYVVPEIDIERFKETGVFAVQLLNNEAMAHDGIYLESDRAKEFAEFFKDNIFPAEKFEELVEWGIKADAESASLVRAIIHSRVWEYEQKRAMTMDQVLVQLCIREYPSIQMQQKQVTLTYNAPYLMKDNNPSWNGQALQMERIRQSQKATTEAVNAMLWEKLKAQESVCAYQEREIYLLKRKIQDEQKKAEISKNVAEQHIAVLTQQLEKKKKRRTLSDRVLQIIGFWVGIIYWLENMDR